ncbi:ABC transporter permease subunit [Paracoccus kondratievae]
MIPLIMPPFVGAVAMSLLFGRNGSINLLLNQYLGFRIPFMEGLNGVILVQSIHYFPFILINLSASLRNIDRSMEEAAQNLGSYGMRMFRRIVFPWRCLAIWPGRRWSLSRCLTIWARHCC